MGRLGLLFEVHSDGLEAVKTIDLGRLLGARADEIPLLPALEYLDCAAQEIELARVQQVRREHCAAKLRHVSEFGPRAVAWEACWQERLENFKQHRSIRDLLPDFLRDPALPLRYFGQYILPRKADLLYEVQKAILAHLLRKWMRGSVLLEFGCGSGYNLVAIKEAFDGYVVPLNNRAAAVRERWFPYIELFGLDWSPSAIKCVEHLGFAGAIFDMLNPKEPETSTLPWEHTTVLTAGAMEQLGGNFQPFIDFLLAKRPRVCIHVEPLIELYDPRDPMDAEAAAYHEARGYLTGFLPALHRMERAGEARIYEVHRTHFGGRFNDGFSWIIWRPL